MQANHRLHWFETRQRLDELFIKAYRVTDMCYIHVSLINGLLSQTAYPLPSFSCCRSDTYTNGQFVLERPGSTVHTPHLALFEYIHRDLLWVVDPDLQHFILPICLQEPDFVADLDATGEHSYKSDYAPEVVVATPCQSSPRCDLNLVRTRCRRLDP